MKHHARLAGLLAAIAFSTPAAAAYISIDDSDLNNITLTAGDFEGGFFVDGVELTAGAGNSNSITLTDGAFSIDGSWLHGGGLASDSLEIWFASASDPVWVTSGIEFFINLGDTMASLLGSFAGYDGSFYFPTASATSPQGQSVTTTLPSLTVAFISEPAAASEVPEPATLALFGLAMAGLGLARRR